MNDMATRLHLSCCSRRVFRAALGKLNVQPRLTGMGFSVFLLKELIYLLVELETTASQKIKGFKTARCKCLL